HSTRLTGVLEAAFDQLPAPAQQLFAMLATNPAPVVVHRLPRFWFVLPMTLPTIRFGDIGPNDGLAERLQGVIAVVSLVGDRLDRPLRVHPFAPSSLLVVQATSAMCSPAWGRVSRIVAVSPASPVATVPATTAPVSRSPACSPLPATRVDPSF